MKKKKKKKSLKSKSIQVFHLYSDNCKWQYTCMINSSMKLFIISEIDDIYKIKIKTIWWLNNMFDSYQT